MKILFLILLVLVSFSSFSQDDQVLTLEFSQASEKFYECEDLVKIGSHIRLVEENLAHGYADIFMSKNDCQNIKKQVEMNGKVLKLQITGKEMTQAPRWILVEHSEI